MGLDALVIHTARELFTISVDKLGPMMCLSVYKDIAPEAKG